MTYRRAKLTGLLQGVAVMVALAVAGNAHGADATAPKGGVISYALASLYWALQQTPEGKTECPDGFNEGNREHFRALYPDNGEKRALVDTQLKFEIDSWYPTTAPDGFVFREAQGPVALGFNLDGKVGPHDFTGPDGEQGVDSQMFRALGCIKNYRGPLGAIAFFEDEMIIRDNYNRILIELSSVDSLVTDDEVQVLIARGRDPLLIDASGVKAVAGGSQRIDTRWGGRYVYRLRGKIVDGVLTTEPADILYPWAPFYRPTDQYMYAARLRLKLSPEGAEGLIGGYTHIETWYAGMMKSWSTHHQNYGQTSAPSLYKALRRLADAVPDPATGANTAISSALQARFTQVIIMPSPSEQIDALAARHRTAPYGGPPFPRTAAEEVSIRVERIAATQGR